MTQTQNEAYMGQFTAEQLEYFNGFPAWLVFFWALATWGSVLGSILLLLRKKLAAPVFLASFMSMVITAVHNFLLTNGLEVMGTGGAIFSAVIFVVALGLWLYARAMAERGVLA
jgi:small basic protein